MQDRNQEVELEGGSVIHIWETLGKDATSLGISFLNHKKGYVFFLSEKEKNSFFFNKESVFLSDLLKIVVLSEEPS